MPGSGIVDRRLIGLVLGPAAFLTVLWLPRPEDLTAPACAVLASALLMAIWWITEAIPIPATALLPIALFPLLGVMRSAQVTTSYADHLIFLYLGGFLVAMTVQRWGLHRRIALLTIRMVGTSPNRIILGFMIATGFLSMWISNTAAAMMMMPIGLAVITQATEMIRMDGAQVTLEPGRFRFGIALMLGIAYSASIGGVATLIGTPPNAILAGMIERIFGHSVTFLTWFLVGFPLAAVMLLATWLYLVYFASRSEVTRLPGGRELIELELRTLGPVTRQEKMVCAVFAVVASGWIVRGLAPGHWLPMVQDSTIAIIGGLALFLLPSNLRKREFLLDWPTAVKLPWDVILLFGGGFALANGFADTGLTSWIAGRLSGLEGTEPWLIVAVVVTTVLFLTEVTSNTATASLTLPVVAALAKAFGIHPFSLMAGVAISASLAFMLPVSTPPNAIVFSTRYISIPTMARIGFGLDLISAVLVTLTVLFLLPAIWGIEIAGYVGP